MTFEGQSAPNDIPELELAPEYRPRKYNLQNATLSRNVTPIYANDTTHIAYADDDAYFWDPNYGRPGGPRLNVDPDKVTPWAGGPASPVQRRLVIPPRDLKLGQEQPVAGPPGS